MGLLFTETAHDELAATLRVYPFRGSYSINRRWDEWWGPFKGLSCESSIAVALLFHARPRAIINTSSVASFPLRHWLFLHLLLSSYSHLREKRKKCRRSLKRHGEITCCNCDDTLSEQRSIQTSYDFSCIWRSFDLWVSLAIWLCLVFLCFLKRFWSGFCL